jgi:sulfoxide reductase heme-binding subunit YedZ
MSWSQRLAGPRLVGAVALLLGAMTALVLGLHGPHEAGWRALVRATARSSAVLFVLAYAASSVRRLWPSTGTRWLLRNRRYLGVSMFVSHTLHMGALLALARTSAFVPDVGTLAAGGLAYLLLAAMAATSWDGAVARLGARRWSRLHRVGLHYVWFVFLFTFVGVAAAASSPGQRALAGVAVAALAGALGLRLLARHRRRLLVRDAS